jgi:Domain of unknown function (DUF4166)
LLYEQILGRDAALLHPQVAALHCGDRSVEASGWMRIHRASTWRYRAAGALLRLPAPGDRVPAELLITRHGRSERWVRRFGRGPAIRSQQSAGPHGELVEQFGPVAFVFAVELFGDQLRFRQQRCRLRLWRLNVPVPRALAPRVGAVAGPAPGGGVAVSVRAGFGPLGLLLAYEGTVDIRRTCDANRLVAAGPARAHRRI